MSESVNSKATSKVTQVKKPGKLTNQVFLRIDTGFGQQMYHGREGSNGKQHITGFNKFGAMMTQVYMRAAMDDPFFDYLLIQIEERMTQTLDELKQMRKTLKSLIKSEQQLEIGMPESVEPLRIQLAFRNPYAYRGADLLIVYDNICKLLNAAKHTGRFTTEQYHVFKDRAAKQMRALFEMPARYPSDGLMTRAEIENADSESKEKYKTLTDKYGEIPAEVLSRQRRGDYAPRIYAPRQESVLKRPVVNLKTSAKLDQ